MTITDASGWGQVIVTFLGLGGIAFGLGRLYGRIDNMEVRLGEIRESLLGAEGKPGAFLPRQEAALMLANAATEHAEFDRRLQAFDNRLGVIEGRRRVRG